MEHLKRCIPELRYLKVQLDLQQRDEYVKASKPELINCLVQVVLNLMYANKNGLPLTQTHIELLKPFKNIMKKIIGSKVTATKKKLLSPELVEVILTIIIEVVDDLELDL